MRKCRRWNEITLRLSIKLWSRHREEDARDWRKLIECSPSACRAGLVTFSWVRQAWQSSASTLEDGTDTESVAYSHRSMIICLQFITQSDSLISALFLMNSKCVRFIDLWREMQSERNESCKSEKCEFECAAVKGLNRKPFVLSTSQNLDSINTLAR